MEDVILEVIEGHYLRWEITPHYVIVLPTDQLREEASSLLEMKYDKRWALVTEDFRHEHGFEYIPPHVAGLTSNPFILSRDFERNGRGEFTRIGRMYYYERYQIDDPVEQLIRPGGPIIFDFVDDDIVSMG